MSTEDHDAIVAMTVQMRQLCNDMAEVKKDLKILKDEHHLLKERVLVNGLKIGGVITSLLILFSMFDEAIKGMIKNWFA